MTPRDFQAHAERLLAEGDPASCRSAVSRSCYAAHHAAVDFLFAVGVRCPRAGAAHGAAYISFLDTRDVDVELEAIGGRVQELHRYRNRADYRWDITVFETPDDAAPWVASGRSILDALDNARADRDRLDLLTDHFREWVPESDPSLGLSLL